MHHGSGRVPVPQDLATTVFHSMAMANTTNLFDMADLDSPTGVAMPLHCIICPKQPTFSDKSHLLTHLDSKGHLAHKHKLEMATTVLSKRTLEAFNRWFNDHNVKSMLQDRAALKKRKSASGASTSRQDSTGELTMENSHGLQTNLC